eukprot:6214431-Pleurochrysis_carterae.AAC.3
MEHETMHGANCNAGANKTSRVCNTAVMPETSGTPSKSMRSINPHPAADWNQSFEMHKRSKDPRRAQRSGNVVARQATQPRGDAGGLYAPEAASAS